MTEDDARLWIAAHVPRETVTLLERYATLLLDENRRQNLIAAGSVKRLWARHLVDSAQLAPHAMQRTVDVGSGAGLPGIVLALFGIDMTLVEPRRLRAGFLERVARELGIASPVWQRDIAKITAPPFDTIVARAYAPIARVFATTFHLAHPGTRWVLPKGRSVAAELEVAQAAWHGEFDMIPSITDSDAAIIVAQRIRPRARI